MKFDKELVDYIDYTYNQLAELTGMEGKMVKIPADLYLACKGVIEPEVEMDLEDEFVEMKKTDVVAMIFDAHSIVHEEE